VQRRGISEKEVDKVEEGLKRKQELPSIRMNKIVSTGSTLLDLAISGTRIKGGGIPAGIIVEISGPSSQGKTGLLISIAGSVIKNGGRVDFLDAEKRLDREYAASLGVTIPDENYHRPRFVPEFFDFILKEWEMPEGDFINMIAADSLDALITKRQEDGKDARGQQRAKEFSEGLRLVCSSISEKNKLIVCSNQEREGESGFTTSGGKGVGFYSSLRIRVKPHFPDKYIKRSINVTLGESKRPVEQTKTIGIRSTCTVFKNDINDNYREAPVSIIFNYGIDDIVENLQYLKSSLKLTRYDIGDGTMVQSLENAVSKVEEMGTQVVLRERVITIWEEIQAAFKQERKPKEWR